MYGWLKASYTVSRFFGLKTSNFRNKSIANSSMFGKKLPKENSPGLGTPLPSPIPLNPLTIELVFLKAQLFFPAGSV
jgi:hypothetical protein